MEGKSPGACEPQSGHRASHSGRRASNSDQGVSQSNQKGSSRCEMLSGRYEMLCGRFEARRLQGLFPPWLRRPFFIIIFFQTKDLKRNDYLEKTVEFQCKERPIASKNKQSIIHPYKKSKNNPIRISVLFRSVLVEGFLQRKNWEIR